MTTRKPAPPTIECLRLAIAVALGLTQEGFSLPITYSLEGTNLVLSWPAAATGYSLQTRGELSPGDWTPVSPLPVVNGGMNVVTQGVVGGQKFYRLHAPNPTGPVLSNLTAQATAAFDTNVLVSFSFWDPDCDIAALEITRTNALEGIAASSGASFLGITGVIGQATIPLSMSGLPFGTNYFRFRLRDSGGRLSSQVPFAIKVTGQTTGGATPVLQSLTPTTRFPVRPVTAFERLLPPLTIGYSDTNGDIERVRVRVQPPTGPAQIAELDAAMLGLVGTGGTTTNTLIEFRSTNALGGYVIEVTLIDRNGNFSNTRSVNWQLVTSGGDFYPVRISSFSPASGPAGTVVTLIGGLFDTSSVEANRVELNQLPVTVTNVSNSQLKVIIPEGASSGPFVVRSAKGTALSSDIFIVPTAVTVSPPTNRLSVGASLQFQAEVVSASANTVQWSVNGIVGGNSSVGLISSNGLFTAPEEVPLGETVTVTATLLGNTNINGQAAATILPPPATPGSAMVLASAGGTVRSLDGRAKVSVAPGALTVGTTVSVTRLAGPILPAPEPGLEVLGGAEFEPDGLTFLAPVTITLPLSRRVTPGTLLPLRLFNGAYVDEGIQATVTATGFEATAQVTHFSAYVVVIIEPVAGPSIFLTDITPSNAEEGMTVPVLLTGSGFDGSLIPVVTLGGVPTLDVVADSYLSGTNEAGILLHIGTLTDLGQGSSRTYTVQLRRAGIEVGSVPFMVQGLDELDVPAGPPLNLTNPPPRRFSRINIASTVRVEAGTLEYESTGPVSISGLIDAKGRDGASGQNRAGGSGGLEGGAGGQGREDAGCAFGFNWFGLCEFDGAEDENFGQNANDCIGYSAGGSRQGPCRPFSTGGRTTPEGMGGLPGENINIGQQLVTLVATVGECIGSGGVACPQAAAAIVDIASDTADLLSGGNAGRHGFGNVHESALPRTGGGGGGGGGRVKASIPSIPIIGDVDFTVYGGGGGAGGDAGGAVRIASKNAITVSGNVTAEGGRGGDGSTQGELVVDLLAGLIELARVSGVPAMPGGGGGGGQGGTLRLIAGDGLLMDSENRARSAPGQGGNGGVTYIDPINGNTRVGFTSSRAGNGRGGSRRLLDYSGYGLTDMVTDRTLFRLINPQTGATNNVVLSQGFNTLTPDPNPLLNISVLVIATDTDGDGLSDADETDLGTDPNKPDTDEDGLNDGAELTANANPLNPDTDGDCVLDGVEMVRQTDPTKADTDGDSYQDGVELILGLNPTNTTAAVTLPAGVFFTRVKTATGAHLLALLNPLTGELGGVGTANGGAEFGLAFEETGSVAVSALTSLLSAENPVQTTGGGAVATTTTGSFLTTNGVPVRVGRMALNPTNCALYGVQVANNPPHAPTDQLLRIELEDARVTPLGSASAAIHALAVTRQGVLFAAVAGSPGNDRLVTLNPTNGAVVQEIGPIGFSPVSGLAFHSNGTLYATVVVSNHLTRLLTVNPGSGAGTIAATIKKELSDLTVSVNPAPSFEPPALVSVGDPGPQCVTLADVNNDGALDIITGQSFEVGLNSTGSVAVVLGNGDGTFQSPQTFPVGGEPWTVVAADLNHDTNLDLVVGSLETKAVHVFLGDGAGNFAAAGAALGIGGHIRSVESVAVLDFNSDTHPDIVAAKTINSGGFGLPGSIVLLAGDGAGSFSLTSEIPVGPDYLTSLAVGDMNEDGKPDLVMANRAWDLIFFGNGAGTFVNLSLVAGPYDEHYQPVVADLNVDGHLDFAVQNLAGFFPRLGTNDDDTVAIHIGNGTGAFSPTVERDTYVTHQNDGGLTYDPMSLTVGDLTCDGKPDIVTFNYSGDISVLRGGRHQFQVRANSIHPVRLELPYYIEGAAWIRLGDLNNDGRLDVVTIDPDSDTVTVLFQKPPL